MKMLTIEIYTTYMINGGKLDLLYEIISDG